MIFLISRAFASTPTTTLFLERDGDFFLTLSLSANWTHAEISIDEAPSIAFKPTKNPHSLFLGDMKQFEPAEISLYLAEEQRGSFWTYQIEPIPIPSAQPSLKGTEPMPLPELERWDQIKEDFRMWKSRYRLVISQKRAKYERY